MALKRNVELINHARSASTLNKEIQRNSIIQEKLESISSKKFEDKIITGMQLRSENWYDSKIQSQITEIKNRQKFLSEESLAMRRKVALAHNRMKKSQEKASQYKKEQSMEKEKKFEASIPPRSNTKSS